MDKQKLASIVEAAAGLSENPHFQPEGQMNIITGQVAHNISLKTSNINPPNIRAEIFGILPELMQHQNNCRCFEFGCQVNNKLLRYFLENEKERAMKAEMPESSKNETSKADVSIQTQSVEIATNTTVECSPPPERASEAQNMVIAEEEQQLMKQLDSKKVQVMQVTKCPHTNRKHYAKNMCSSCYRKFGRN